MNQHPSFNLRDPWVARIERRLYGLAARMDLGRARSSAWVRGIALGPHCRFYGQIRLRRAAYSTLEIGEKCTFRSARWSNDIGLNRPCMISTLGPEAVLRIGEGCGFSGTVIAAATSIVIGDSVACGANVTITDTDWHGVQPTRRHEPGDSSPVVIEDNVWIGLNVIVLKGVTIGRGSVIAAGSVVTSNIPAEVIAAGAPAKVIGQIPKHAGETGGQDQEGQ